jgi:hypothetical protein
MARAGAADPVWPLQVFCLGIVLSFCAQAATELSLNSLWIQIFAGITGILVMIAVAYYELVRATGWRALVLQAA